VAAPAIPDDAPLYAINGFAYTAAFFGCETGACLSANAEKQCSTLSVEEATRTHPDTADEHLQVNVLS
jgi:hypothetical protein